jgi:Bax protein
MNSLEEGVPKLIVESLPDDLDRISRVSEKKRLFFLTMLPMILMANEEVRQEREKMLSILERHNRGVGLRPQEAEFITALAKKYKINGDPLGNQQAQHKLVLRVDVLPASLVLAQAANESAWGTSRFAQRANNLFGEWTFTPGTGLVPRDRPSGATYEVRKFPTVYDSVRSYLRNINTHRAYHDLRLMRARMRTENLPLLGVELAKGLTAYSTRREEYVREIAAMIRHNDLSEFSTATLRGT